MKNFHDLFVHELRDMYFAEKQIEKILPQMAKTAHSSKLKEVFREHHKETQHQMIRLEKIADQLGISLTNTECDAIVGILKEGRKLLRSTYPPEVRDAALIISAQRVEHYEMA